MKAKSNSAGYGATRLTDWGGGFGEMKRRIQNNQTMIPNQTTPLRSRHVRYTIVNDDDDSGDTNDIMIRSQNNNNIIEFSSSSTTTNTTTNTSIHKMKQAFL